MASPFPSRTPADPLSLFEPEEAEPASGPSARAGANGSSPVKQESREALFLAPEPEPVFDDPDFPGIGDDQGSAEDANVLFTDERRVASPVAVEPQDHPDVSVEVVGPPPPADAVSFDHVRAVKELHFVEGVALVQATCEVVSSARPPAGVPALEGLFLTPAGDVVPHGPPTGEPPARELARLLHQLVAPQAVPPAGRLFIGRWINSTGSLTEFASELAYFARPNGRELLAELHARSHGVAAPVRTVATEVHRPQPVRMKPRPQVDEGRREPSPLVIWIQNHYPKVLVAVFVLAAGVATAAWLSQSQSTAASRPLPPISSTPPETPAPATLTPEAEAVTPVTPPGKIADAQKTTPAPLRSTPARSAVTASSAPVPPPTRVRGSASPGLIEPIQSQDAARGVGPSAPALAPVPAPVIDLHTYSAADADVQPPRLLSAEIFGQLIKGWPMRTNQVELVIGERGDVQQVQMIGAPQRIPDIMQLSRAKELRYEPATRNGKPVRYRLRLTWNVTP